MSTKPKPATTTKVDRDLAIYSAYLDAFIAAKLAVLGCAPIPSSPFQSEDLHSRFAIALGMSAAQGQGLPADGSWVIAAVKNNVGAEPATT